MRKKILSLIIVVVALLAAPMAVWAASTATLTLTVTVAPSPSVWIGATTYGFGNMDAGATSISQTSIAVINDSAGLTQKYSIRASDAMGDTTPWSLAASAGADQYNLRAVFRVDLAVEGDFTATTDDVLITDKTCDGTVFATGIDQDGFDSAAGKEERLWFRIAVPTSVTDTGVKTIYITIIALAM